MLHIVTLGEWPMKTHLFLRIIAILALGGLAACAVEKQEIQTESKPAELVFATAPEAAKGKLDVYDSMARAAKYNADTVGSQLHKRIFSVSSEESGEALLQKVIVSDVNDENRLMEAARALEFAVIYGVAGLSDSLSYTDNYFYESAARSMALKAIKLHQNAWFAGKELRNLDRLERQEKKIVDALNAKEQRDGTLSEAEYDYRKNQQVLLHRLDEMRSQLEFMRQEYAALTQLDMEKVSLEGRRFYELEDFDKDYSIEVFQEAAVRNRTEFALAKSALKSYAADDLRSRISNRYPPVSSLDVNGLKIENEVYERKLYEKALNVAVNAYKRVGADDRRRPALKEKAFDEVSAAVVTQLEVGYQLVKLADAETEAANRAAVSVRKEVQRLEKLPHPSFEEKLALFNTRLGLEENELAQAQRRADRAAAVRGLYFHAGLSPLGKKVLKASVKNIAQGLKKSFNQDLINMMSGVQKQIKVKPQIENVGGWAKDDNWLEEVVNDDVYADASPRPQTAFRPQTASRSQTASRAKAKLLAVSETAPRESAGLPENKAAKIMQLGAYVERHNADDDWKEISAKVVELKGTTPQIETAEMNGQPLYRLVVKAAPQKLEHLCRKVMNAGYECLLR